MSPPDAPEPTRRALLAAIGAGAAALAGCAGGGTGTPADGRTPTDSPTDGSPRPGDRPTATPRDPRPVSGAGSWPQRGRDPGHSGVSAAAGVPEAGEPYWRLRRIRGGPAVLADGRLFHYAKLGADTGGRPTVTRTRASPAGTAHPVYGEPHLVARDAREGRIQWSAPLRGPGVQWPAVAGDRVVVAVNGQFAAFDAADGSTAWDRDLGERILGDPTVAGDAVLVPVQGVVDGATGETIEEPQVRAYGLDGSHRWTVPAPKRANSLAVAGGTAVVVSGGFDGTGVVVGLGLADGSSRWRTEVAGDLFGGPVVAGGRAYVTGDEGDLWAFALRDGAELWRRTFERGPGGVAADDRTVYVGGERVSALAAGDGRERWTFAPGDRTSFGRPAVGDGTVYAGGTGTGASLFALDAGDGTRRWSHGFPNTVVEGDIVRAGVEAQPTVADRAVYAPAVDGLYAFGPAE